jgi:hypothetical protein
MAGPTSCEKRWSEILASFQRNLDTLTGQHIHVLPRVNGNDAAWKEIITRAEAERAMLCKHLEGKVLFTGMLRLHTATHREMRDSLQPEEPTEEFREQRRYK